MPLSSAVVAGNPALASQYNNLRSDALALTITMTSGEAFSVRDLLYVKESDKRVYKADADAFESGLCRDVFFAATAATGAAESISVYTPGSYITGFSGLTQGTVYYPSGTAGALSASKGAFNRPVCIAESSTVIFFFPGKSNENLFIEPVVAGENWSLGALLYQKKSDGRYYRADADAAESGICEYPAIAVATHTGGAASTQLVYMPGSTINGVFSGFATGGRLYPSSTTAAFAEGVPVSYDTYYRVLGNCPRADVVTLLPQEMQFLPTGVQEKGFVAAGSKMDVPDADQAAGVTSVGVNFKKIMVNAPSSITTSSTATSNISTVAAADISRFGFRFQADSSGGSVYYWSGTYQTVGN